MDDIETVETPQDDLRSVLAESLKGSSTSPEPQTQEHEEAAPEPKAETSERPRGPDGKFLPKDASGEPKPDDAEKPAADAAGEGKPAEAPKDGKTEKGDQAPAAAAQSAPEPPLHWSQADKEKFNALPAEAKAVVLDMNKRLEGWYTPKLQRLSHLETEYGQVVDLFAPHRDALKARGQVPADIIKTWANVEQTFLTHKAAVDSGQAPRADAPAAVARIIAGYRIDPKAVADALTSIMQGRAPAMAAQPAPAADPRVDRLTQQLEQLTAAEQARIQAAEQEKLSAAQRQIDTFANEKDGEGNLAHPFFAELEQDIMALAQLERAQGRAPVLSELYDRAVWANPSTREKLRQLQTQMAEKRAAAEQKAKSQAAARASVSVSGSPGATRAPNAGTYQPAANAADDLRAAMREARA